MKSADDPEVWSWLAKVAEDYRVAELLILAAEPLEDAVCFHCQQAVEKLLKALLVAEGVTPPRTHDLETLSDLLMPARPLPDEVQNALAYLSELAINPRYPLPIAARSPGRAQRTMTDVELTIAWVQDSYGWSIPLRPAPPDAPQT